MCPLVDGEVSTLAEVFPTVITLVGFLSRVDPLVYGKVGTLAEGFPALVAFIGFLSRVHPLMCDEG